jgi:hypothetical protein
VAHVLSVPAEATWRCCSRRFPAVLVDLTVAIEVGIVLAAFLFMRRMAG